MRVVSSYGAAPESNRNNTFWESWPRLLEMADP